MKIVSVVGARPQFIKCAPLSKQIRMNNQEVIVHTGQHYDPEMSRVFFDDLGIPEPDYNLGAGSGSHAVQTGKILISTEGVLLRERPDLVLVFGDTNSTIAGALAATKLGIPVAHVEAGLRSFDRSMPEETNRVLTDHISELLFTPTKRAMENLRKEGIVRGVHNTGDVMVDSLKAAMPVAADRSKVLERFGLEKRGYLAMTVHRASNTDEPGNLRRILKAVGGADRKVVFPVHPRTRKALGDAGLLGKTPSNLLLVEPLGYLDMLSLMAQARAVVTDSGGMQKEAFILGVRCITLRENTEWRETLVEGRNRLVGLDEAKIGRALSLPPLKGAPRIHPFGRPGASQRIAQAIGDWHRG